MLKKFVVGWALIAGMVCYTFIVGAVHLSIRLGRFVCSPASTGDAPVEKQPLVHQHRNISERARRRHQ